MVLVVVLAIVRMRVTVVIVIVVVVFLFGEGSLDSREGNIEGKEVRRGRGGFAGAAVTASSADTSLARTLRAATLLGLAAVGTGTFETLDTGGFGTSDLFWGDDGEEEVVHSHLCVSS